MLAALGGSIKSCAFNPIFTISLIQFPLFLAQTDYDAPAPQGPGPIFWIIYCAVIILLIASMWKVFSKAGHPGWACLIPIYNIYIMCKIAATA